MYLGVRQRTSLYNGTRGRGGKTDHSRLAAMLLVQLKANLNSKDLSVVAIRDVLDDQERRDDEGHNGRDKNAMRARLT